MSSWFGGAVNGNANAFEFRIVEGVTFAVFPIHSNTGVRVDWGDGNIEYFGPITGQEHRPTAYSLGSVGWIDHNYTGNTFSKILKIDGDLNGIYPGGARFFLGDYVQNFATPGIADKIVSYGTVPLNRPSKEFYLDYSSFGFWLTGVLFDIGMFSETWETSDFAGATKIPTWNLDLPTDSQPDFRGATLATALFSSTSIGTTGAIDHWIVPFNTVIQDNNESWFARVVTSQDPTSSTDGATRYPFNMNISRWFSKGCPQNCNNMFRYAPAFNQDLSVWNMSNAIAMANMFSDATSFNQDLGSWNVSNVINFSGMFNGATAFNNAGATSIDSWNTSSSTSMNGMFNGASSFNQPIGSWNVSNVTNMNSMFSGASSFNQDISSWNVSNNTVFSSMFKDATAFNQDIGSWDVSGSSLFNSMFENATSFNQDLSSWNISTTTNMSSMFKDNTAFNNGGATGIGNWDVSSVTNFNNMFDNADAFNQPLLDWDCSNGNFFREMFRNNNGFGVTNESGEGTNPLNWTLDTIGDNNTIDMSGIFRSSWFNSDISGWDVSGVREIERFAQASRFNNGNTQGIYGDINTWTWDNCFDFRVSFFGSQFNQPIGNWTFTTSRTILASDMFAYSPFNQDISNWDVSLFSNFQRTFRGSDFDQDLGPWGDHLYSTVSLTDMLNDCNMSTENYSRTLIGFANYVFDNSGPFNRNLGAASLTYHGSTGTTYGGYGSEQFVDAVNARAYLTGTGGWTITDGGSV